MDILEPTKALIEIRKAHPCFRLNTVKKTNENCLFTTIADQVLVYRCFEKDDQCIAFFNPTGNTFTYDVKEEVQVLFDNGNRNEGSISHFEIAPYSVVVAQYK